MISSVSILGSTGSIGRQSIAAAEYLGVPVKALAANRKIDMVEEQARRLNPILWPYMTKTPRTTCA